MSAFYWILIGVFAVLSALYSASDAAISSVNLSRLELLSEKGDKRYKLAYEEAKNYDNSIATILFGNDFVNIFISSLLSIVVADMLSGSSLLPYSDLFSILISVILVLILGDIFPKTLASNHPLSFARFLSPFIKVSSFIFYPFVTPISFLAKKIASPIIEKAPEETLVMSDDELAMMVEEINDEGIFDDDQSELLHRSLSFKDTSSYDIMTPRVDIVGYDIEEPFSTYLERDDAFKHSRIIVYKKDLDHVLGYIQAKTLLRLLVKDKKVDLKKLILPTLFVPRTQELSDVLSSMKDEHIHIAVIKDEFGGTEGIVTMEDILEELVGEMWDEDDKVALDFKRVEGTRNSYIVSGSVNIERFFEKFEMDEDVLEDDYSTLSGYINDKLGRFAEVGDKLRLGKVDITVKEVEDYCVKSALVRFYPKRKEKEE